MSQITTHILDTSAGRPASAVKVTLFQQRNEAWQPVASGLTNADGRVSNLLQKDAFLEHGEYKLRFETASYFSRTGTTSFYPFVEIVFCVTSDEHYHVPLLLNPFGYSTYRGS